MNSHSTYNKENRAQTRLLTKKMAEQQASREPAREKEREMSEDDYESEPQSDDEGSAEETPQPSEEESPEVNELKLSVLKVVKARHSHEGLIQSLRGLLGQGEGATHAPKGHVEETAPEKGEPAQPDDPEMAEACPAPDSRRPSWNDCQPMGSQGSNYLAGNGSGPESESEPEETSGDSEGTPTDRELRKAIKVLTATLNSNRKRRVAATAQKEKTTGRKGPNPTCRDLQTEPQATSNATIHQQEIQKPRSRRNNKVRDSNSPPRTTTNAGPGARQAGSQPTDPKRPSSSHPRPESSDHRPRDGPPTRARESPRLTTAAMPPSHPSPRLTTDSPPRLLPLFTSDPVDQQRYWSSGEDFQPTRSEPNLPPAGLGPGLAAAAAGTFPFGFQQEMGFAHAQSVPEAREQRLINTSQCRLTTDIPKPYCEFSLDLDHGQQSSVSSHISHSGTFYTNLPKLNTDGGNLVEWNQQLQLALMREGLLFLVDNPPQRPWTLKTDCLHHKAFCIVIATIPAAIYPSIVDGLTVYEIVQLLHNMFYSQSRAITTKISREFHSIRHKPGVPMSEHILKLNAIRAELIQRGETITEESLMSVIINSLDSSWDNFITQLDVLTMRRLSLGVLTSNLIAEDNLRRDRQPVRREPKPTRRVDFQDRARDHTECYTCGSRSHLRRDCPKNNRDRRYTEGKGGRSPERRHPRDRGRGWSPNPRKNTERRDSSRESNSGYNCGLKASDTHNRPNTDKNTWLLDSGASNHTTHHPDILDSVVKTNYKLKVADQREIQVRGKGNTYIPQIGKVEGVLYVPDIPQNVLAAAKLTEGTDTEIIFRQGKAQILRHGKEVGKITMRDGLPYFTPNIEKEGSINTQPSTKGEENKEAGKADQGTPSPISIGKPLHDNCAHLLHRKLGHSSFPVVKKMPDYSEGLKVKNCENYLECSICKGSKIKTKARPKVSERTTSQPFQLVHMDVVGPLRPSINHKKRFFLNIVDDYTRYGYVFCLKHKSEVPQRFKEFYKRIELQHNTKIKQIMTDRGSEFMAKELTRWLRERGIAHYTSSPFSPHQNGISERKNGVLQTMIRCVLDDAGMSQSFWAEALHYSNYTLNRLWSSPIDKTPYEMLYNRKPNLAHLHVFGAPADVHIPRQLRRKGDRISKRLRFVGYEPGTKGYRFIDSNNRFIVSRTAEFHEHTNWSRVHANEVLSSKNTPHSESDTCGEERKHQTTQQCNVNTEGWKEGHPVIKIDKLNDKETEHMHEADTQPNRPIRENRNKLPQRLKDYVMTTHTTHTTPDNYNDMLSLPQKEREKWESAMEKEMESLRSLQVYSHAQAPADKKPIGTKWVFRVKTLEDGKIIYKARLVAQGFAQRYPEDYTDTYSPTVRAESVKSALVVATILGLQVFQFDVQTAYLHAKLDKEIYVKAPPGYDKKEGNTWLLNKSLYGLKQSGKRWYECLSKALTSMGFKATTADMCLFTKGENDFFEAVLVYVDDILYIGKQKDRCNEFATKLGSHFSLKSLGKINKYLGVQVTKTEKGFRLSQKEKITELIEKCNMPEAKPCEAPMQTDFLKNMHNESEPFTDNKLYRSTIGSLLYIANWTRPDIALAVNLLSRHVSKPTTMHWEAIKRILKYLKFSVEAELCLEPETSKRPTLTCYADADWAGDIKSRKSTSGYVFFLNGSPIHWYTGKQKLVATSTTEAEYVCLSKASNSLIWFDDLLKEIWTEPTYPIVIHEDNKAAIEISMADAVGKRSRHIDIKCKHVRQLSDIGFIRTIHCDTEEQIADILTKPLPPKQHNYLMRKICVYM